MSEIDPEFAKTMREVSKELIDSIGKKGTMVKLLEKGMGRNKGNKPGSGPGGSCVCPSCGKTTKHKIGTPCYTVKCPSCGAKMKKA
jgi:rubrerythrin